MPARLVVVHGVSGNFWALSDDGVWAIVLDTGETTELLTPASDEAACGLCRATGVDHARSIAFNSGHLPTALLLVTPR